MLKQWLRRAVIAAGIAGMIGASAGATPAGAAPFDGRRERFADNSFQQVWSRTDEANVRGGRSWIWGPKPWFDYYEFYRQGVNGLRLVQYFDKARMEINNPNDRSFQGGVTNGLLVVELVSGDQKQGNAPTDALVRGPAEVPVAGNPKNDNPNAPTYASFLAVATVNNGYRDTSKLGQRVTATLDRSGNIGLNRSLGDNAPETEIVQYNSTTGHNIPRVFWDYLNQQGRYNDPIYGTTNGPVVDWLFAMGLPITDAYWVRAKIGAQEKDVLVQLFERRVLTYVRDNPAGYKVEMGNVGQHYFQWRYPDLGQPWAAPNPEPPLLFTTDYGSESPQIALWQFGANTWAPLTREPQESVAFSYRRSFDPTKTRVLFDSRRGDGKTRQLYELNAPELYVPNPGQSGVRRLTFSDAAPGNPYPAPGQPKPSNDYNASISPDASKIAFVSDRSGVPQLYLMWAKENAPANFIDGQASNCTTQVPVWSPDGRTLYWEQQCPNGKFAVMRGDLRYREESNGVLSVSLVNVRALTDQGSDNRYPRVSPDGTQIAFTSYRDGNAEIYLMGSDGSRQTRLTSSAAADEAATWRADGRQLAFASNRDGNYELYVMNTDGSGQTRLTNSPAQDRWPLWAQ
ncbi:MAG: DPP IV N-terminal domain-containing protein [Roseiflexaceae bacterium]